MKIKEKCFAIVRILVTLLLAIAIPGFVLGLIKLPTDSTVLTIDLINLVPFFLSFLFILLACFVISKVYKIKMRELGILFTKHWARHFGVGICIGTLSITAIWIISILFSGYSISVNVLNQTVLIKIVFNLLTMLMVGYYEEALTRGLMTFVGAKNSKLFNAIVVGIVFSLMHLLSPSFSVLSMVNTLLIAIVFSMLTWISGDLWVAIGYHAFWNFVLGSILGVPTSGLVTTGLLTSSPNASPLISGGGYGLEASLICTIFLFIQIAFLYVLFIKKGKTNKAPAAPWLA